MSVRRGCFSRRASEKKPLRPWWWRFDSRGPMESPGKKLNKMAAWGRVAEDGVGRLELLRLAISTHPPKVLQGRHCGAKGLKILRLLANRRSEGGQILQGVEGQ